MIVLPRDKFDIVGLHRNKKDSRRDALYFVSLTCSVLLGIFGIIVLPLVMPLWYAVPVIVVMLFALWYVVPRLLTKAYYHALNKAVYVYKNAHERFDRVPLTDTSLMDDWYHDGALVIWTDEDKAFDLFYNWLRDTGLTHEERVTVYEVTKELFLSKYPYVEDKRWSPNPDTVYVLPLSSTTMPRAKREVWNLVTVSHNYVRCIQWFTYLVNGTRNEKEYGLIHTYKDLIEDFEEI